MAFTRKHMNALAGMMALQRERLESVSPASRKVAEGVVDDITLALSDMLASDEPIFDNNGNRRFDRARFIRACNGED